MKTAARRARRVAVALWRFARLPKWLVAVLAAAVATPLPFDDILAGLVVVFIIAWQLRTRASRRRFARYMAVAWSW